MLIPDFDIPTVVTGTGPMNPLSLSMPLSIGVTSTCLVAWVEQVDPSITGPGAGIWFGLGAVITALGTSIVQPWFRERGTARKLAKAVKQIEQLRTKVNGLAADNVGLHEEIGRCKADQAGLMARAAELTEVNIRLCGSMLATANRYLPISELPVPPQALATSPPQILVVEDVPDSLDPLVELLGLVHCKASGVGTRASALAALDRPPLPDFIILDLRLPDGDGLDVLREVKRRGLPIQVIVTTGSDPSTLAEVQQLQPAAILQKPVNFAKQLFPLLHLTGSSGERGP